MKRFVKNIAKKIVDPRVVARARSKYGERSYSQEGEDRILHRMLENDGKAGFYIDVGAHHPYRFSNTCLLYKAGWRGINIDALPGSMAAFRKARPDDINLEMGISNDPGELPFYVFPEGALNSFDLETAKQHAAKYMPWSKVINVPLRPLSEVIEQYANGRMIDLLTVDVEGHDLSVLQSNDWSRFRPRIVLAEALGSTVASALDDARAVFMRNQGYSFVAKTVNTCFFADSR